jgi:hypothetical protein
VTARRRAGYLPELRAEAAAAFADLRAESGLEMLPEAGRPHPRENSVGFRNRFLRLDLHFDAGAAEIGAGIAEYDVASPEPRVRRTCPLAYLLGRREPDSADGLRWPAIPGEPLAGALRRIADLLRRCAGDLLAGDFRLLDELCPLVAADRRADLTRRFGTSTGETPRFDRRPTLAELFSDVTADAPGRRTPRCYQAVHDHGYSPAEVAAFLALSEPEVDALLAEWDHLA